MNDYIGLDAKTEGVNRSPATSPKQTTKKKRVLKKYYTFQKKKRTLCLTVRNMCLCVS